MSGDRNAELRLQQVNHGALGALAGEVVLLAQPRGAFFQNRKVAALLHQEIADFLGRGQRAGVAMVLVKKVGQLGGHFRQPAAFLQQDAMESALLRCFQVIDRFEDFRG